MRSKTLELIRTFNTLDWKNFEKYLKARYTEHTDFVRLFRFLKKNARLLTQTEDVLTKAKGTLFKNISDKSFINLQSKLTLEIEDFFVYNRTQREHTIYKAQLLKEYADRGLYHIFDKKALQLEKELRSNEIIDLFNSIDLLQLDHMRFFSDNPTKVKNGDLLVARLEHYVRTFSHDYNTLLSIVALHLKEVSNKKQKGDIENLDELRLSGVLLKLLEFKKSPNQLIFNELRDILIIKDQKISKELEAIIIDLLIHYSHKQIEKGNIAIIEELLDLYYWGIDSGNLLSNNKISENKFINLISTICACGMFDKASDFIDSYNSLLVDETREGTIVLSYAHIAFYQRNYSQVIEEIRDYPFVSLSQNIRRRWLLLCSYFKEINDEAEFLKSAVKNYNNYFYSNKSKLSPSVYLSSLNLAKALIRMDRGLPNEEILNYISASDHLVFRTWLIKEIEVSSTSIS